MENTASSLSWYFRGKGADIIATEAMICAQYIPRLFGYYALQIGFPLFDCWLKTSTIPTRLYVSTQPLDHPPKHLLVGEYDALPIQAKTMDLVLLPHLLEITKDIDALLREATRVLRPDGHLVILGFSPWQWLKGRFHRRARSMKWKGELSIRPLPALKRKLKTLDYEILVEERFYHNLVSLPDGKWSLWQRIKWRFVHCFGDGYCLIAKPKIAIIRPVGLSRWQRLVLSTEGAVPGTTRNSV